jgi:hypothetical protein
MRRAAGPTPCDPRAPRVAPRSVARRVARLRWRRARRVEDVGAEEGAESAHAAPTALGEATRTAARAAPVAVHGPTEADAVRVEGLVARAGAEEHDALVVAAAAERAGVDARHPRVFVAVVSLFEGFPRSRPTGGKRIATSACAGSPSPEPEPRAPSPGFFLTDADVRKWKEGTVRERESWSFFLGRD